MRRLVLELYYDSINIYVELANVLAKVPSYVLEAGFMVRDTIKFHRLQVQVVLQGYDAGYH